MNHPLTIYLMVIFVFIHLCLDHCHSLSYEDVVKIDKTQLSNESYVESYLAKVNIFLEQWNYEIVEASWNFSTDMTNENQQKLITETAKFNQRQKDVWNNIRLFNYTDFKDPLLRRQLEKLSVLGVAALDNNESDQFTNVTAEMSKIYSSASICLNNGTCGLELEPHLVDLLAKSRDYNLLKEVWLKWRENSTVSTRNLYMEYVRLGNKAAVMNGFKTLDDLWLFPWETPDFKQQVKEIWDQLQPYYLKLHAYVRSRLRKHYGDFMPKDGTIPAHILGNMWAHSWSNIFDLVAPYPKMKSLDVSEAMRAQNYTSLDMFRLAEKFFTDLALIPMPEPFWQHSLFTKPSDRKVVCHASAWDFYNRKDFRIKMCTSINMQDLITIHHEMGHIQYYLQYKNQPPVFREGANPGFHEAVGDLLALSVSTPNHLNKIQLLTLANEFDDTQTTLNYQMRVALDKLAFLPFGYLMDAWRWDIFSGKVPFKDMNKHWWKYRLSMQGVSPPEKRSEKNFDAASKYHIPAGVEYIRYFVSFIIQFQFHKSLCDLAQPNLPLHKCDIDGNLEAGQRLARMLQLGSSKPWPEAMKIMTGSEKMTAQPLIEYFSPLFTYLDQQLQNETLGWNATVESYFTE